MAEALSAILCRAIFIFILIETPILFQHLTPLKKQIQNVIEGNFDESDLEEAKFEMIQGLDSPISPGSQAEVAYGWWREGRSFEIRQAFRNKLLALTREEVIECC